MSEAVQMELVIAEMEVSEISEKDLENTFQRVVVAHKDAVRSIHASMQDADDVYRKYLAPGYIPLEDVAKKDRAALNKAEKNIAEQYAILKEAYEKPLANTEANIKSIRSAIKEAAGIIDKVVKNNEEKQQAKKRAEIQEYFDTKAFDLVTLDRIFDKRWLNKGTKMQDIREKIDEDIAGIYRDIEVLECIPEYGQTAKAIYLETLDMGAALRQVDTLKANAERLALEQVRREERKNQEQVALNDAEERQEKVTAFKTERVQSLVDDALDIHADDNAETIPEILEFILKFSGTKEQLMRLREYMTQNNIPYEKAEIFNSDNDATIFMRERNIAGAIHSLVFIPKVA